MDSRNIYVNDNYDTYKFKSKRKWRTDGKYEPFVYIIQEVETEMMYIGSKTASGCLESCLGTTYFTSSKRFDWKSNPYSFEICKIIPCASNHDALILENLLIDSNHAVYDDIYYNMSRAYTDFSSGFSQNHTEDTKIKISEGLINYFRNTPEAIDRIRIEKSGENSYWFNTHGPMHNKKHTEESKEKISLANSGKNNPMFGLKGSNHPKHGIKNSSLTKSKMSKVAKHRPYKTCPHCDKNVHHATYNRWHGNNCKYK